MHIGIPFDIETVRQSWGQAARMWGRVVANHDFLAALVAAGGCSRVTLYVPSRGDVQLLERTLVGSFVAGHTQVEIVPYAHLPAALGAAPPDVMHMLDPNMWLAAHVRAQLAARPFVVTGVTHSLANQHFLQWALLNSANGVGPDDCLVCTTDTARSVVEGVFSRLRRTLPGFVAPATAVIPLGVGPPLVSGSREEDRAQLGWSADAVVVLSLARFHPQFKMDLRPVLRLAGLVAARAPQVRFVLAGSSGDGGYLGFIREQARAAGLDGCVSFEPDPDEARKAQLLQAADVFLSLSDNLQETFGLTVVEALGAGLPVVASDWDGYRSLVEEGRSGFLVPTKSLPPDPLWEAALALRSDPLVHLFSAQTTAVDLDVAGERLGVLAGDAGLRRRMGAAARLRAHAFEWPVVIARYIELWTRLLHARSALRFIADFAGYPTSQLAATDRFRTTAAGSAVRDELAAMLLYHETDEFLDLALCRRILQACVDGRSVTEVEAAVLPEGGSPGLFRVGQNLLWLYKYGYLALA